MGANIEIVNGPFTVWAAPVGESFTDLSQAPGGNWAKIGTSGERHYGEEGVVLTLEQELTEKSFAGGTEILEFRRTLERFKCSFSLFDLRAAQIVKAFNLATTTNDTAAGASAGGSQDFDILRGLTVTALAILIRGENMSPDLTTENVQIEIPAAIQAANLEMVFNKSDLAGVAFELQAKADYTYNSGSSPYGRIFLGDAAPTS
jgi:hypothetical protein